MNDMHDYLQKRATELDLGRGAQLAAIQAYLDELYPGHCRAVSLNDGVLKLTTPNASVASELRLRQVEIMAAAPLRGVVRLQLHAGSN
jgi:hypothetical protein